MIDPALCSTKMGVCIRLCDFDVIFDKAILVP